jgi:hypothetical protein
MRGNEKGTCHKSQTFGKVKIKTVYNVSDSLVEKASNSVLQVAISKIDTFKLCCHGFFIF